MNVRVLFEMRKDEGDENMRAFNDFLISIIVASGAIKFQYLNRFLLKT